MHFFKILTLAFTFCLTVSSLQAEGIEFFHGTWQEALVKAQDEGKIVFVDAYTTWCGPCKRMSKNVFTQDKVGSYFNENFVNIKVDMEKPNGREFGAKYPVSAYPTLFFLEPTGKLIKKSVGGKQVDQLYDLGAEIVGKFDYSAKERALYEEGDRSYETVLAYVQGLNKSGKSSLKVANDYLLSDHGMTDEQLSTFLFEASTEVDSKIFEDMLKRKSKVVALVGEKAFQDKVVLAANGTVDKAVTFEDAGLMKAAFKAVKKSGSKDYKKFVADSNMKLASAQKDEKTYLKNAKTLMKSLSGIDEKIAFGKRTQDEFSKSEKVIMLQYNLLKKEEMSITSKPQIDYYVKMLLELKKNKEALTFAEKLSKEISDQATLNYLNNIIKHVKRLEELENTF